MKPLFKGFKDLSDESRLPLLLGEDAESCGLAAHYIAACHKMRDSVTDREREKKRKRKRERQRERDRETERERKRETEKERERDRAT